MSPEVSKLTLHMTRTSAVLSHPDANAIHDALNPSWKSRNRLLVIAAAAGVVSLVSRNTPG